MDENLIAKHHLEDFGSLLRSQARPCHRGYASKHPSDSFCGGLPWVDEGFVWPDRRGRPLDFVAQIACRDVPHWPKDEGALLFFYDNEHWGLEAEDKGFIKVLWQLGEKEFESSQLPTHESKRFFGLLKNRKTPVIYQKVPLIFVPSLSYPSHERLAYEFPDEFTNDNYAELLEDLSSPLQLEGYPLPIQNDDMEADCAKIVGGVPEESWRLLVQMEEVGDQVWGDAGCLYWFIPEEDLAAWRFDRVWMSSQCH